MQILNSLIPIFAIIGLGLLLRRSGFLDAQTTRGFNRFAYWFALPLFLFYKLAIADPVGLSLRGIPGALSISVLLTAFVSWLAVVLFKTPAATRGAMIQASFRGNLAFMGLPLVLFLIEGLPEAERLSIEAAVMVALAPVIIFYNAGSIVALAVYNEHSEERVSFAALLREIAGNPLIWACAAGLGFQFAGLGLPVPVQRACSILGGAAFPLALVGIGSQLFSISGSPRWAASMQSTLIKCVLSPAIAFGVGSLLGLEGAELQAIVVLCGVPTAVSSFVLADQMNADSDFAASAIITCTAASLPTLSVLIWLT